MDYAQNRARMQRGNYHRMVSVERCPENHPVGIAYVTVQTFGDIYPPEKALAIGTIFVSLDYPFTAAPCCLATQRGGRL